MPIWASKPVQWLGWRWVGVEWVGWAEGRWDRKEMGKGGQIRVQKGGGFGSSSAH